jgi:hypothetical protein
VINEEILKKLAKLKAMTEDKNNSLGDVEAAAEAMGRLMLKYNIDAIEIQSTYEGKAADSITTEETVPGNEKNQGQWASILCGGIATSNHCICWVHGDTLHIYGDETNVAAAKYMFAYLRNEITRLAKAYKPKSTTCGPKAERRSFSLGAASEINRRLRESRATQEAELRAQHSKALVLLADSQGQLRQKLAQDEGITLRPGKATRHSSANAYESGQAAGRTVNLSGGGPALGAGKKAIPW